MFNIAEGRCHNQSVRFQAMPGLDSMDIKIHSSCEIDSFVETHLWELCGYTDRAIYGLRVLIKNFGRWLPLELQCSYQGQQGGVSRCVGGNYKTHVDGDKIWQLCVEGNASV